MKFLLKKSRRYMDEKEDTDKNFDTGKAINEKEKHQNSETKMSRCRCAAASARTLNITRNTHKVGSLTHSKRLEALLIC